MGNKEDWEELEKWQENQNTDVVDKYGINIYDKDRTKENKKIEMITKVMNKILKVILGIIIFLLIIAIIAAFSFIITRFSTVNKSVNADINDITRPFGEKVEIVSKDVDEKENGEYILRIKSNKNIVFKAIKNFGDMQDDFLENAKKYHFENWEDSDKSSFIVDESTDENGLLDYDIYIQITSYNEIDEATKKVVKLANYSEERGMYYLAFGLPIRTNLHIPDVELSDNSIILSPYNRYPYPKDFDPVAEVKKQYLFYIDFYNIKEDIPQEEFEKYL